MPLSVLLIDSEQLRSAAFGMALEASPTGMMLVDESGHVVQANSRLGTLFGYTEAELVGIAVEQLVPARFRREHPRFREGFLQQPGVRPMGAGRDLYGLRKDGSEVPIEIGLNPLNTTEGTFVLSSVIDITERKRAVDLMRASLHEKETLLREVHHRVKNNLQVITSLINLQSQQLVDPSTRAALEECKSRVQSIALIHETLYQSNDYGKVPLAAYARTLSDTVAFTFLPLSANVQILHEMSEVTLPVDQAIPCGLILTELLTNALKHAFPAGRAGQVTVGMQRTGDAVEMSVRDDGVGLGAYDPGSEPRTVGMQLVRALASQLDGELTLAGSPGTSVVLRFKTEERA